MGRAILLDAGVDFIAIETLFISCAAISGREKILLVRTQIDLTTKEGSIVEICPISRVQCTKETAIKKMISLFKVKINPETLPQDKYFKP